MPGSSAAAREVEAHTNSDAHTPAYALSKAAVNALTRVLAPSLPRPERAGAGVWLSAVCPGDVRTRMCTSAEAVSPGEAARDVVWLALQPVCTQPNCDDADEPSLLATGRFWRDRRQITF